MLLVRLAVQSLMPSLMPTSLYECPPNLWSQIRATHSANTEKPQSIVALARPSSISKPVYQQFQQRGVELREIELPGAVEKLVEALSGLDVVISAISAWSLQLQIDLADAAKKAGVKRFVPCSFMTVMPPGGRALLRDEVSYVGNRLIE